MDSTPPVLSSAPDAPPPAGSAPSLRAAPGSVATSSDTPAEGAAPAIDLAARRRLWLWLALAGVLGVAGALPYLLPLLRASLATSAAAGKTVPALWVVALAQVGQICLLAAASAWVGTRAAPVSGLDAPFFRALAERRPAGRSLFAEVPRALLWGTAFSAAILLLNHLAAPLLPDALQRHAPPAMALGEKLVSFAQGASSAFYGGIVEELLLRWCVLALIAAGLWKLGARGAGAFWAANLLAAILFGAGHLPAVRALGLPLTLGTIGYIVAGNAIGGLVCGWQLRRRGLEAGMITHGWGDVCLHAFPLLFC